MLIPKRQLYKKATEEQRKAFGQTHERMRTRFFLSQDGSSVLRDYYRRGQRLFRAMLQVGYGTPDTETLNDLLEGLNESQREGFLMGWQSDAYAHDHGLELSVEGGEAEAISSLSRGFG